MKPVLAIVITVLAGAFILPASAQSSNPWAVPRAPMLVPGQVFASTSGVIGQNFYSVPNSGLVPSQPAPQALTSGSSAGGAIPYGDYPPLEGLALPAPAAPMARQAQPQPQPLYVQPNPGTAYAYTPYGAPAYGTPYGAPAYGTPYGAPAYGAPYGAPAYGGYPPYGGNPSFGGPFGGFPGYGGGFFPGNSGMFGLPFGGANLTPWGMGSPWMW